MSVNSDMADSVASRVVTLQRFAAHERRTVLRMLKRLETRLVQKIESIDPTAPRRTEFQQARMEKLLDQTRETIKTGYAKIGAAHVASMTDLAEIEMVVFQKQAAKAIGVDLIGVGLSSQQLKAIASDTLIGGAPSKEWWGRQSESLTRAFSDQMRLGMLQGDTTDKMVRRLTGTKANGYTDGVMNVSRKNAEALVRTSVQTTANAARGKLYEENQDIIKGIQWVATFDNRTTVICAALHGKAWSLPDYEPIGHEQVFPGPTAHWNCRSTQTAIFKSFEELGGVKTKGGREKDAQKVWEEQLRAQGFTEAQIRQSIRDARSSMDGEIPKELTFEKWIEGKPKSFQDEFFGAGRAELWRKGEITLSQMVDQTNRPLTLDQLKSQP